MRSNPFTVTVEAEGTSVQVQVTWPHRAKTAVAHELNKVAAALDEVNEQTYASEDNLGARP